MAGDVGVERAIFSNDPGLYSSATLRYWGLPWGAVMLLGYLETHDTFWIEI